MNNIVIRESIYKILKKYFLLFLLGTPILIMVFGEPQNKNSKLEKENFQQVFLWIYIIYCSVLLVLLILRIYNSQFKSIIRLDEKGITMQENSFFAWEDIYDFRTGTKILKYNVLTTKGHPSGNKEFEEQKILTINQKEFIIKEKFLNYKLEEIAEIIRIYKTKIEKPTQALKTTH